MEIKINGIGKKNSSRNPRTPLAHWSRNCCLGFVVLALFMQGCSLPQLKQSMATGASSAAVAGVTSGLSGGALLLPAVATGTTAVIASSLTAEKPIKSGPINAETVIQNVEAPDTLFSVLEKLISVGGIGLLIFLGATYLLPLILGYLIPNGFERKKKKR